MIDGEIYALDDSPDCVFAYCERGRCSTSFYIGVYSWTEGVKVSSQDRIYGMAGDSSSHLATEYDRERFYRILDENGYKWNQENKVIVKDGVEIIKI